MPLPRVPNLVVPCLFGIHHACVVLESTFSEMETRHPEKVLCHRGRASVGSCPQNSRTRRKTTCSHATRASTDHRNDGRIAGFAWWLMERPRPLPASVPLRVSVEQAASMSLRRTVEEERTSATAALLAAVVSKEFPWCTRLRL